MKNPTSPFIISGYEGSAYFCDRQKELNGLASTSVVQSALRGLLEKDYVTLYALETIAIKTCNK